jgi:hypothetical protein
MTRLLAAGLFVWGGFVGSGGVAFGQATSGSAQIVEDARRDYYNLGREGVKEFRCDVKAPWDWFTARSSADAAARDRMHAALEQVHFDATVGGKGAPKVTLHYDGPALSDDVAMDVRAASGAAKASLSGVMDEFSSLLFGSPLPPDRDYHVEDQGDRLRVTFGSDEVRIVETMKKDHAIEEMIIATQHSTVTVRPVYQKTEKGFLPVAIDSKVEAAGADPVELHVEIGYQAVDGFQLPQSVTVRDKKLADGAAVKFAFSGCQVTR